MEKQCGDQRVRGTGKNIQWTRHNKVMTPQ